MNINNQLQVSINKTLSQLRLLYPCILIFVSSSVVSGQYNYGLEVEAHDVLIEGKLNYYLLKAGRFKLRLQGG